MPRTCASCAYFNRERLLTPVVVNAGTRFPATAQCRRTPPPWPVLQDTDWCGEHSPRPGAPASLQDDGA